MKAMILRADFCAAAQLAHHFAGQGLQPLCASDQDTARAMIRADTIDLIVMDERIGAQLTHALALSAERCNPCVSVILMSDRDPAAVDDLFVLIPSLCAVLGMQSEAGLTGKIALCALADRDVNLARVSRQMAADLTDLDTDADDWPADMLDDSDWFADSGSNLAAALLPLPDRMRIMPAFPPRWGDFAAIRPHRSVTAGAA